ncbi:hypothetical protein ABK040_004769 [Willaertia magna]
MLLIGINNVSEDTLLLVHSLVEHSNKASEQIKKTSKAMEELTKKIDKLNDSTNHFNIHKVSNGIENKLKTYLCNNLGFGNIPLEYIKGTDLEKLGCDVLMISQDKKTVIIGEVKTDLVEKAFNKVNIRVIVLKEMLSDKETCPDILKNVENIIPMVGAETITEQLRKKVESKGYLLIEPNGDGYSHIDFSGILNT